MENTETRKPRFRLGTGDRVVAIAVIALIVLSTALGVLQRMNLALIEGQITLLLPLLVLGLLLGWGISALVRRIRSRAVRVAVGVLLGLALFILALFAFSYASFVASMTLPRRYSTMTSPSGSKKLVVLRRLDGDEDRVNARRAARLKADPDADGEITVDDWGYVYTAAPQVARFFYRSDADVEGEVAMGYASKATLMLEWAEDERQARFYLENPGVAEGGEMVVKF